jgi:Ran GTPase-activating protein (RanGAP) involved in mRNA processing and transport
VRNCTHMTQLAYIDISYNNIGGQGVRALVSSLALMTNLTYIKLDNNSIRKGVIPTIKTLFEQMPNLKVVIE